MIHSMTGTVAIGLGISNSTTTRYSVKIDSPNYSFPFSVAFFYSFALSRECQVWVHHCLVEMGGLKHGLSCHSTPFPRTLLSFPSWIETQRRGGPCPLVHLVVVDSSSWPPTSLVGSPFSYTWESPKRNIWLVACYFSTWYLRSDEDARRLCCGCPPIPPPIVSKVGSEEISNQIMSPFSPSQTRPGGSWINNIQIFTSLFFQIMFKIFPQLVCFVFYRGKLWRQTDEFSVRVAVAFTVTAILDVPRSQLCLFVSKGVHGD
jgi:hypothetical protein